MQEKITKDSLKILDYESYRALVGNLHFTIGDEIWFKQLLKELKNPYVHYFGFNTSIPVPTIESKTENLSSSFLVSDSILKSQKKNNYY